MPTHRYAFLYCFTANVCFFNVTDKKVVHFLIKPRGTGCVWREELSVMMIVVFKALSFSCLESENLSYVCTPWQNSAYPLAESFAVDEFCQGYTCWLHVCYAYRKGVALTLLSRAIAIFHLPLGMMVDGWQLIDVVGVEAGWHLSVIYVIFSHTLSFLTVTIRANGRLHARGW